MTTRSDDVRELERVTIRFAGDSGAGSQLAGQQFTNTAAIFGNDVSTEPDYPAEIRAPAGAPPDAWLRLRRPQASPPRESVSACPLGGPPP